MPTTLLTLTLQGSVLIATIALLRVLLRAHIPRRAFVALWFVAVLRLLMPFQIPSPASIYQVIPHIVNAPVGLMTETALLAVRPLDTEPEAALTTSTTDIGMGEAMPRHWTASFPRPMETIYFTGVALLSAYFLAAYVVLRSRFRSARPITSGPAADSMVFQPYWRNVRLLVSEQVASPVTFGLLSPCILLPESASDDADGLPYILAHELTHIRRMDAPLKLFVIAALCVHWFNPAVWLLYILYNRDVELSCDEQVIRRMGHDGRRQYAHLLLDMQVKASALSPLTTGFCRHYIKERIVTIMKYKKTSTPVSILALLLVISITCIFGTSAMPSSSSETVSLSAQVEQQVVTVEGVEDLSAQAEQQVVTVEGVEEVQQIENYKIVVDVSEQLVSVYVPAGKEHDKLDGEYLKLVKEMHTVMDLPPSEEILGTYTAEGTGTRWLYFQKINCWVQWAYYIDGTLMFHSLPSMRRNGDVSEPAKDMFNGYQSICLSLEDAQWIWENCDEGATVVIQA